MSGTITCKVLIYYPTNTLNIIKYTVLLDYIIIYIYSKK